MDNILRGDDEIYNNMIIRIILRLSSEFIEFILLCDFKYSSRKYNNFLYITY